MANSSISKVSVDVGKMDLNRVSATAAGAADGTGFIPEENILKSYWGDENGEVEFVPREDGTYLIEQDGVAMGFTDQDGYDYALKNEKASDVEVKEPIKGSTENLEETLNNIDNRALSEKSTNDVEKTAIGDLKEEYYKGMPVDADEKIEILDVRKTGPQALNEALGYDKLMGIKEKNKLFEKFEYMDFDDDELINVKTNLNEIKKPSTINIDTDNFSINDLNGLIRKVLNGFKDVLNTDETLKIIMQKNFGNIYDEGYEVSSEIITVDGKNMVIASKEGERSRLYVYDENFENCQYIDLNFKDNFESVTYDKDTNSIKVIKDGNEIVYTIDDINSTLTGPQSLAFATDSQKYLVDFAPDVPSPGAGWCAAWVSSVFADAGYGSFGGNACNMYDDWCTSSDKADLKPGMIVAVGTTDGATDAGTIYGHVGIYIGNNQVIHNIGNISVMDLDEWIAFYGHSGEGRNQAKWGWLGGNDLSEGV